MTVLKSKIDASVNFVTKCEDGGYFESRYVRRTPQKLAVYLSSQSGCNRGCKFCHLTATKQTMFTQATKQDYINQAMTVANYYVICQFNPQAEYAHFNFMARGEPLCNPTILKNSDTLFRGISSILSFKSLLPKFNISTIMPLGFNDSLSNTFRLIHPTIYYSLYSLNKDFRQKWLPTSMPPEQAIKKLKEYQDFSKKLIRIHGTFIKGENDSLSQVIEMFDLIDDYKLEVGFNLVRYNPFDDSSGEESPQLNIISTLIKERVGINRFKEVSRVGFDVKGSCGMFFNGNP